LTLTRSDRPEEPIEQPDAGITRRRLLLLLGAGGAGIGLSRLGLGAFGTGFAGNAFSQAVSGSMTSPGRSLARWSDGATWGGAVPGRGTRVVVSRPVLLDVDAEVARVEIVDGASLTFDPAASRSLRVHGNVVVAGQLQMRPSSGAVTHRLAILDANESGYQGGTHAVQESDPGVWVMDGGLLDVAGSPKRAWTRAAQTVPAGARSILLTEAPTGWRAGDTVVITPTLPPDAGHHEAYDEATIAGVSGRTVTLSRPTRFAHPAVSVGNGVALGAEVLNLTRNVEIEGTPNGRAHVVFLHARSAQSIRHAAIRHVGPRNGSSGVVGRYGLHFHMLAEAARGTLVEGVVVRDAGNHAFVTHASHGVTLRNCISHHTMDEAYWWDPGDGSESHDTLYEGCVASHVRTEPDDRGFRLSGFWLGHGHGNTVRDCVAIGVSGARNSSGYVWPERASLSMEERQGDKRQYNAGGQGAQKSEGERDRESGIWTFENCVAHNNALDGIFVWQNSAGSHVVDGFVGYHNGKAGIEHGAYHNRYQYRNATLYGNGEAAVILHAVAGPPPPRQAFIGLRCDGAERSDYLVVTGENHPLPASVPTDFRGCSFRGARKAAFGLLSDGSENPDWLDVVDCSFEGNEFWLSSGIHPESAVRVQDAAHGSLELRRADQAGSTKPQWNARVTPIARFDPDNPPVSTRQRERSREQPEDSPENPGGRRNGQPKVRRDG
jgi:hypothetical protein